MFELYTPKIGCRRFVRCIVDELFTIYAGRQERREKAPVTDKSCIPFEQACRIGDLVTESEMMFNYTEDARKEAKAFS